MLHVVERLATNLGSLDELLEQFPFVSEYLDEAGRIVSIDCRAAGAPARWIAAVGEWEAAIPGHLPIRTLRNALHLDDRTVMVLCTIGLIEEDPRFGFLIESAQPGTPQQRPTLGLLTAWWRDEDGASGIRESIRVLLDHGLIQVMNHDAPRLQWTFQSPSPVWDAFRGDAAPAGVAGFSFVPHSVLPGADGLILPERTRRDVSAVPALLRSRAATAVVVRGPRHNGRRSVARAIAGELGRSVIEVAGPLRPDDERWAMLGVLATLLHAMPIVCLDVGLGDTCELSRLRGYDGPLAVAIGKYGSVTGDGVATSVTIPLAMPGPAERSAAWARGLGERTSSPGVARELAQRFRMTTGTIVTASALAQAHAALDGRSRVTASDVRVAGRALHGDLERLAARVQACGGWECLGAPADTLEELRSLEERCRHRERLHDHVGPALGHQLNCGVRALFAGPSGTGKTMAARLLASALEADLYRLDLASVVNKYIGETEKSLDRLFSRAEELDVILLIDEGDALLTSRTAVATSNDRYANLETNYLLQRLEAFDGIVIITTNAVGRIDSAFQRRMDVVVDFRMPGPHERWLIWQLHLPVDHHVDAHWLQEAAVRCDLSGGQIRNAVLHASLAALEHGRRVSTPDLEGALQREYRKTGTVCPLPRSVAAGV